MTKKLSRETVYCETGYGQNIGHFDTCPKEDVYIISSECHNPNPDNFYTRWDCVYEILKVDESDLPIEELKVNCNTISQYRSKENKRPYRILQ